MQKDALAARMVSKWSLFVGWLNYSNNVKAYITTKFFRKVERYARSVVRRRISEAKSAISSFSAARITPEPVIWAARRADPVG